MIGDSLYVAFGEAVALRRDHLGMTQAQLAARVGLSRASIANIEGGRQNVLLHHACSIAAALGLSDVGDLLPVQAEASLEDQALTLSEPVSRNAQAQINSMIAKATAKAKS
ncbi:helix-turn-helix transcriptional regulator [Ancylobacter crimeensis]|uniref:Helix-turn-helix domain-containing protein n=1 Tax=Ancylobacter crimeensis TaxID=2579147 RepID=A0ABT0DBU1_9HYPH|nr:helix-turn-helix transcriptional regulator [Ancylobacter crimeensis]MCK0197405.1 helix-turn-helix domain-containing protein [Ancylobacter crimeensis]